MKRRTPKPTIERPYTWPLTWPSQTEMRALVQDRNFFGRTAVHGITEVRWDISIEAAAKLYRENWNGCREAWKRLYRFEHYGWRVANQ